MWAKLLNILYLFGVADVDKLLFDLYLCLADSAFLADCRIKDQSDLLLILI